MSMRKAICKLSPNDAQNVEGIVYFQQKEGEHCQISGKITGLSDGDHGFHVHEFGNVTQGCVTAGGHFNPHGRTHGGPDDDERHIGDMGNVQSSGGVAEFTKVDKVISLFGEHTILGRSVVVHADPDDLGRGGHDDSKTTGHAGGRKACGVIGIDKVA
eukprot:Clim_evm7s57 gene=Clim_evmTU7s57